MIIIITIMTASKITTSPSHSHYNVIREQNAMAGETVTIRYITAAEMVFDPTVAMTRR